MLNNSQKLPCYQELILIDPYLKKKNKTVFLLDSLFASKSIVCFLYT